ncbi:hypothetical protein Q0Z83_041920 [Actinoplanes sichuanensis]|nr:hypothetical protein Q0Z83_041920 [Actinoplanes sichuanensis]
MHLVGRAGDRGRPGDQDVQRHIPITGGFEAVSQHVLGGRDREDAGNDRAGHLTLRSGPPGPE